MALKYLIFLVPLLFASCALGKLKIYCTDEDMGPAKKDDKKDCPSPKGSGGDAADKKDCPDPKGGGGGGGGGGDKKDCPDPKGGGGGGDAAPKDSGGGGDKKDCPDPKGGGGGAPPPCPDPKGGGAPPPPCPDPKGGGAPPPPCPDPKGGGAPPPPCPDPKGGGAPPPPCPDPKGGGAPPPCPDPKGGGAGGGGSSDKKDCPDPKGGGSDVAPKGGGGASPPCPDPKGGGSDVAPKGGGGASPPCPDPKGGGSDVAPKGGGGASPPCPDPKGGGGDVAPKGDGGSSPPCPDPKGGGGDKKDGAADQKGGGGGASPKGGGGAPAPAPDPKGAGGGGKGGGGTPPPTPDPKGGGGGKGGGGTPTPSPDPKGAGGGGGKGGGGAPAPSPKGGGGGDKKDAGAADKKKDDVAPKNGAAPFYKQDILDSDYKGEWIVHNPNCGVNAMQHQLMPNNKAVWFDTTNLGPSARELGPKGNCPPNPDNNNEPDCFAHAIQYDIESGDVKSVYVETDPWCSSGHMLPTGDLLSTGGNKMGERAVRLLKKDDPAPKFVDRKDALGAGHWYASNCVLEDGSAVIIGGRDSYTFDHVPPSADFKPNSKDLPFLQQTTQPAVGPGMHVENNLYPFVYMLPDGNIFIFANDRAISFNPQSGQTVKEYPVLQGGSRNYPPSGQSALLPLRLTADNKPVAAEIVVCGGNKPDAFPNVDPRYTQNRVFAPALADCNRIIATADNPTWQKEQDMPSPRTMGDLLVLPNAQFLLLNGAKKGTSGWDDGEDPNLTPTVYMPENEMGKRFKELKPTNIPRMYHSSSSVLPDGKILVAGSNAHQFYTYDGPYPTELRVEKFSPHYLDPKFEKDRPVITADTTDKVLKYGKEFKVAFTIASNPQLADGDVIVTLLYPPFTTHGFSQNQRMVLPAISKLDKNVITAVAPASGKLAPPGYYILFVSHRNIPSKGIWVQLGP